MDVHGTLQLLFPDHARERDKALLRGVLAGGVCNGFLLGKVKQVPCRFWVLRIAWFGFSFV